VIDIAVEMVGQSRLPWGQVLMGWQIDRDRY
jgi:hypothetical protein